jgi:hypothetical protein
MKTGTLCNDHFLAGLPYSIHHAKGNISYKLSQYDLHENVMGRTVQLQAENPVQHVEANSYKSIFGGAEKRIRRASIKILCKSAS